MPGWTLLDTHPTRGRTFQRPLDALEVCYLWDGLFNGTADSLHHYELRLSNGAQDTHLFSEANITRAWTSTKRRFPLAGAVVCGADDGSLRIEIPADATAMTQDTDVSTGFEPKPHFVVQERDLATLRPGEIVFEQVTSAEEAQRQAVAIVHGPRTLSAALLARLYVFREIDAGRNDVLHLMIMLAHCVTDGTSNRTFMRCLLDTLARGGGDHPPQVPLEERLAMAVPPMDLEPEYVRVLSLANQRWRRAVGTVIFQSRMAKMKGGHTLPCRLTRSTWCIPARPGLVSTSLTSAQTDVVIANCRLYGLTFGHAYLALAQVAMTRVLYRRYLCGTISEEEWAYRQRQPHINGGPLNLRRFLDEVWFDKGGGGEFVLCMSLFVYQLPFMTLGAPAERNQHVWSDGAPPFSELLTFDRFLHRARLVKKQATAFFGHPLFLEIVHAMHLDYVQYTRSRALRWMQRVATTNGSETDADEDKVLTVTDIPTIWAHGGSSLGNVDLMSPTEYPLPSTHPLSPYASVSHPCKAGYGTAPSPPPSGPTARKIMVENAKVRLRTRPAELYLGAATSHGRMDMYVQYDGNVFEDGVVEEWLDEVREAVLWYLGRTAE